MNKGIDITGELTDNVTGEAISGKHILISGTNLIDQAIFKKVLKLD